MSMFIIPAMCTQCAGPLAQALLLVELFSGRDDGLPNTRRVILVAVFINCLSTLSRKQSDLIFYLFSFSRWYIASSADPSALPLSSFLSLFINVFWWIGCCRRVFFDKKKTIHTHKAKRESFNRIGSIIRNNSHRYWYVRGHTRYSSTLCRWALPPPDQLCVHLVDRTSITNISTMYNVDSTSRWPDRIARRALPKFAPTDAWRGCWAVLSML